MASTVILTAWQSQHIQAGEFFVFLAIVILVFVTVMDLIPEGGKK